MRISDWSSDVCSSDLAAAGSEQGGEAEHDEARARGGKRKERMRHQISPLRLPAACPGGRRWLSRSEEHTSELQSLMRISYAVFCLKNKTLLMQQRVRPRHERNLTHSTKAHTPQPHEQPL